MDNSNVALITKLVLEAVEKRMLLSRRRFSRSNRSVRKTYPSHTGACRDSVWRRLPSYKVQRTYGWTVCIKRKGYNCWS